jgi:vacuolar-type H+-ATPase subunit E/Vma4
MMVDQERLTRVGEELAHSIPSDILEAKEILKQKESIVSQAHLEAKRIKEAAGQEAMAMTNASQQEHLARVDETEIVKAGESKAEELNQEALQESQQIVQDAQRRAYRILDEAEAVSATRREGADQYARETLFDLEERLAGQLGQVRKGIDALGFGVETRVTNGSVATPS